MFTYGLKKIKVNIIFLTPKHFLILIFLILNGIKKFVTSFSREFVIAIKTNIKTVRFPNKVGGAEFYPVNERDARRKNVLAGVREAQSELYY